MKTDNRGLFSICALHAGSSESTSGLMSQHRYKTEALRRAAYLRVIGLQLSSISLTRVPTLAGSFER
jgi:hypothetical protein